MVLKRLQRTLFGAAAKPGPAPAAKPAAEPPPPPQSLLLFGHKDSAMRLSQLESLAEAVRAHPERIRGVVLGLPFERVERTLNGAGFDTAENLISFNAPRSTLRFLDEATGLPWHIQASEFERIGKNPSFTRGYPYPIAPELCFSDWVPAGDGTLAHRATGRRLPRPDVLLYQQTFPSAGRHGYDGLAASPDRESLLARFGRFHTLGLNTAIFLRHLIPILELTGHRVGTPLLHRLLVDAAARARLFDQAAAILDHLPAGERKNALRVSLETLRDSNQSTPPMAVALAKELHAATCQDRDIVAPEDLLIPGKIWHVDTSTNAGRFIAYCVKQDLQRQLLQTPPNGEITLLFSNQWTRDAIPELDSACLARKDILQCYCIPDSKQLAEKEGAPLLGLLRGFPRHFWHTAQGDAEVAVFERIYPYVANARQQIAFLAWDKRLEETEGVMRETPINLNVDGLEISERANQSRLKRTIERGGFAID